MADNITLNVGTGGAVVAADDITSVWYQRVKLTDGLADATTPINAGNGLAANALRVTLPTDGTGVVGLNAGTNNIGDVDVLTLPALPAGTNTIGAVGLVPRTSGGLSTYTFLSTAAVQAVSIKASAGQFYGLTFFNTGAAAVFVRLYNLATAPATTDVPIWRGIVPGNTAGAGFVVVTPAGVACSVGIGLRVTAAVADADATALAANGVIGNVLFA